MGGISTASIPISEKLTLSLIVRPGYTGIMIITYLHGSRRSTSTIHKSPGFRLLHSICCLPYTVMVCNTGELSSYAKVGIDYHSPFTSRWSATETRVFTSFSTDGCCSRPPRQRERFQSTFGVYKPFKSPEIQPAIQG